MQEALLKVLLALRELEDEYHDQEEANSHRIDLGPCDFGIEDIMHLSGDLDDLLTNYLTGMEVPIFEHCRDRLVIVPGGKDVFIMDSVPVDKKEH